MNDWIQRGRFGLAAVLALLLLLAGTLHADQGTVQAPSVQPYGLTWYSTDGGGAMGSYGGRYVLSGTIGQPDAGLLTGGPYTLGGGFWKGGAQPVYFEIYLPIVMHRIRG